MVHTIIKYLSKIKKINYFNIKMKTPFFYIKSVLQHPYFVHFTYVDA